MNRPKITALINTFNYGAYVCDAIESVSSQDVPADELEILVVDDGSTDDTRQQVSKFAGRVRYLYQSNKGQAAAINLGCERARGEIVALLDADDIWLPGKISRVLQAFEDHPDAGLVYHKSEIWDVASGRCCKDPHDRVLNGYLPDRPMDLLCFRGASTSGQSLHKANLRALFPIPDRLRYYADSYLMYLSAVVAPVVMIDEYLTRYRIHGGNFASSRQAEGEHARRRSEYVSAAVQEVESWLRCHGYDQQQPALAAYLKRHQLWAKQLRMTTDGANRFELLRYFLDEQKLFGSVWPVRECFRRSARAAAVLLLGQRNFRNWGKRLRSLRPGRPSNDPSSRFSAAGVDAETR